MAFPQPLSLELSACQKTLEAEGELEAPSLPQLPFWSWVPLANVSLSFRQELISLEFKLYWWSIMQDKDMTKCRLGWNNQVHLEKTVMSQKQNEVSNNPIYPAKEFVYMFSASTFLSKIHHQCFLLLFLFCISLNVKCSFITRPAWHGCYARYVLHKILTNFPTVNNKMSFELCLNCFLVQLNGTFTTIRGDGSRETATGRPY